MARKRNLVQAVGYLRTSCATNVGPDKDSEKRQRAAIERFAKAACYELVDWFYDPAVKGEDPIESRPGFSALLDRVENNGVKVRSLRTQAVWPVSWSRKSLESSLSASAALS